MALVHTNSQLEDYKKTFTAFGGADITATFDGTPIGSLQAITYSVQREKVPLYSLGKADPIGFGRGKRGMAGSLIFNQFDREALMEAMLQKYKQNKAYGFQTLATNLNQQYQSYMKKRDSYDLDQINDPFYDSVKNNNLNRLGATIQEINSEFAGGLLMPEGGGSVPVTLYDDFLVSDAAPQYVDQLMPFNITILFANEYGHRARMELLGVEILNEGMSMSVDDVQLEKAMTFVFRGIQYIRPFETAGRSNHKPNYAGGGAGSSSSVMNVN